jgi:hypothetical protein
VFSQVEEAIILEDGCLPHPSFFRYCQELLAYTGFHSDATYTKEVSRFANIPVKDIGEIIHP